MKKIICLALFAISAMCLASPAVVNAEESASNAETSFFLAIGDYFTVLQSEITILRQEGIPDEEIPVVFFMAQQAKVAPTTIMKIRLKGKPWMEITTHYGFGTEIFYVPVEPNVEVSPLYDYAYGYYKNRPRKEWSDMNLRDPDIINLVNLKFLSENYKYPAYKIMEMRQDGMKFYEINDEIVKQQQAAMAPQPHKTGVKKQFGKLKKFLKKI